MARPYPSELEGEIVLRDGARLPVRPIRLQDAALLVRLFDGLSRRSRYQRFMQHLNALPPDLLQRFTRVDYERALALVVLDAEGREVIAVGRYAPGDGEG